MCDEGAELIVKRHTPELLHEPHRMYLLPRDIIVIPGGNFALRGGGHLHKPLKSDASRSVTCKLLRGAGTTSVLIPINLA